MGTSYRLRDVMPNPKASGTGECEKWGRCGCPGERDAVWEVGEVEGEQSGRGGGRKAATPGSAPSTARRGEGGGVLVGGLPNVTW